MNWKERFPQKKPAKKGTTAKNSKGKKSKEIAGPEGEKNLAVVEVATATVPLVAPVVNAESAVKPAHAVDYKPKEFAEARLNFIKIQRAQGLSFAEASKSWSTSEERADLLADLPVSELKRRRFI